jgi:hypothetical protein
VVRENRGGSFPLHGEVTRNIHCEPEEAMMKRLAVIPLGLSLMIGGCVVQPTPTATPVATSTSTATLTPTLVPKPTATPEAETYTYEVGACPGYEYPKLDSCTGTRYDMPEGDNAISVEAEYNEYMPAYCRIFDSQGFTVDWHVQTAGEQSFTCRTGQD